MLKYIYQDFISTPEAQLKRLVQTHNSKWYITSEFTGRVNFAQIQILFYFILQWLGVFFFSITTIYIYTNETGFYNNDLLLMTKIYLCISQTYPLYLKLSNGMEFGMRLVLIGEMEYSWH